MENNPPFIIVESFSADHVMEQVETHVANGYKVFSASACVDSTALGSSVVHVVYLARPEAM